MLAAIDEVLRENDALPVPFGVRLIVGQDEVVRALE